jgi:polar amino acid transport system substrate-binding protein
VFVQEVLVSFRSRAFITSVVLAAAASLTLSGCASNDDNSSNGAGGGTSPATAPSSAPPATSATSAATSGAASSAPPAITKDTALAAMVPSSVLKAGKLLVGVDSTYAPNEYKDSKGNVVGFDVDLFNAVAAKLGLQTKYVTADFANIIPSVQGGKYSIGVSSFTDNKVREKQVDFVDYFSAGTQWASRKGSTVDPDNACGLKVAVQTGTVQASPDLPARSKACTNAGKKSITIQKYTAQSAATTALALGKVDAMAADSPITAYAVAKTGGKLQLAGKIYDAAPYGYAIAKNAGTFKTAVQKALQALIDDGNYAKILAKWGVTAGAVKTASLDGATS